LQGDAGVVSDLYAHLCADVTALLERVQNLVTSAESLQLRWSEPADGAVATREALRRDAESVARMELRMPIVAPMKAGKSTIINAIVGYELLPARAQAMTTLPTRIVLDDDRRLDDARLELSDADVELFGDTVRRLGPEVGKHLSDLVGEYPHLQGLLEEIRHGRSTWNPEDSSGLDEVHSGLARLNDLIRLSARVLPNDDVVGALSDVPLLRTGHWRSHQRGEPSTVGTLAIIDTPGPNEAGIAARLTGVVADELRNSHVVLVVFDYTGMGTKAESDIRDLIGPVLGKLGKEKLYAVVNKVDQRKSEGDLDKAGVRKYVKQVLQLDDDAADQRIYEVTAWRGLVAARVLHELAQYQGDVDWSSNTAMIQMLKETSPLTWEDDLEELDRKRLERLAIRLWERSGLNELLDNAISRLRADVAPILLGSALDKHDAALATLDEAISAQRATNLASQATVAQEKDALDQEYDRLQALRRKMPTTDQLAKKFGKVLDNYVKEIEKNGHDIVEQLLAKSGSDRSWMSMIPRPLRVTLSGTLDLFKELLPDRNDNGEHSREFDDRDEAQNFATRLAGPVMEQLRSLLDVAREGLGGQVDSIATEVIQQAEKEARPIIEKATSRLQIAFDITLRVPPPIVSSETPEITLRALEVRTRQEKRTKKVTERKRTWRRLWLWSADVTTAVEKLEDVQSYVVTTRGIATELANAFRVQLRRLREELEAYVVTALTNRLTDYHDSMSGLLSRYQAWLVESQRNSTLSEEQQRTHDSQLVL